MADDHNQRPYRGNETPARGASGGASGSDPLAELARLIGQNDPFSEFGRDGGRRAPAASAAPTQPIAPPPAPSAPMYGSPDFARQPYGGAPLSGGADLYHVDNQTPGQHPGGHQALEYEVPAYEVPGYGAPGYDASGFPVSPADAYQQDSFSPDAQQRGMDDDYYDDAPPNRRRIGILAIAGVFALAVVGTAGAFGYRAIFGSSSVSGPPPVIKAEAAPSKIVPATTSKDTQASKISERVNDRGQGEKLVSREEQPVAVTTTGNVFPPRGQNATLPGIGPQLGSGVVGSDPKRVRTISIKPDQPGDALPAPQAEPTPQQPRVVSTAHQVPAPTPTPAPARTNNPPQSIAEAVAEPEPARAPAPRAAPPARAEAPAHTAAPPANAPLSLNPNAAPARAAAPQRTAAAAAPAAVAGHYAVQVSAQRSEAEAQAAFRSLQGKFPGQLGNRQSFIKRVDLGEKGIYFRAMVGPFPDSGQASSLCSSLKAAGGSCLVQKN